VYTLVGATKDALLADATLVPSVCRDFAGARLLRKVASTTVDAGARERLEGQVRALCDRGDHAAAATLTVRGYGPEILGFLIASLGSETDAEEVFAELSEILWRKLPMFAWDSSLRTWSYAVARNVSRTFRRNAGRRRRREGRVGESALEEAVQAVRTETQTFLRTGKRARLEALRNDLPEEDRALLVLRVDRRLEWNELARILREKGDGTPLDAAELAREAARLRKRFQLVRDRLRERAKQEGLASSR
jgi:RNA polymerase sigma-70 factor (ECF subfamily)